MRQKSDEPEIHGMRHLCWLPPITFILCGNSFQWEMCALDPECLQSTGYLYLCIWKLGRCGRWCIQPLAAGVVKEEVSGSCHGVLVWVAGRESSAWGWVPCLRRCRKCSGRRITGLQLWFGRWGMWGWRLGLRQTRECWRWRSDPPWQQSDPEAFSILSRPGE